MRSVEPQRFRDVMGHFATGVTVVTASDDDGPVGMTANAVASLSLDPLLALVCFANGARTLRVVREQRRFGVNVLAKGQEELARLFASKAPERQSSPACNTPCTTAFRSSKGRSPGSAARSSS